MPLKCKKGAPGRLLVILAFLVICGCSHSGLRHSPAALPASFRGGARLLRDVPFYPQEKEACGPAALASVLNYWNADEDPSRIAQAILSRGAGGVIGMDLEDYAAGLEFRTRQYRGSLRDLKGNIDSGHPLIVLVNTGVWILQKYHFMTIVGYENEAVFVHSGRDKFKRIADEDFIPEWEKADFWTLLILPPLK